MSAYLVLKNLQAHHVNAMNTWYCVGAPSPTAFVGLSIALEHRFDVEVDGVAILHQGFEAEGRLENSYGRREFHPNQVRGLPTPTNFSDRGSSLALSDQPMVHGIYDVSLVIRVRSDDQQSLDDAIGRGELQQWLLGTAKIAGGIVQRMDTPQVVGDLVGLESTLKKTNGFWVMDRRDLLEEGARQDGEDQLDAAVRCLFAPAEKTENDRRPWLSMTSVGYHRVTDYAQRHGARKDLPHAFAEPLTGLIEYKSKRHVDVKTASIFWRDVALDPETLVVQQ